MRWLLATAVLVSACHSGGGALPPSRLDVAPVTMTAAGESKTGLHVAYGMHWASLSPSHKTELDIGLGYIFQGFGDEDTGSFKAGGQRGEDQATKSLNVHAIYLEGDRRIGFGDNHRTWAGLRAEYLLGRVDGDTRSGVGLTGRLSWELYGTVKARDAMGAFALGTFIEVGVRALPDRRNSAQTLAGLTIRLPAVAGK